MVTTQRSMNWVKPVVRKLSAKSWGSCGVGSISSRKKDAVWILWQAPVRESKTKLLEFWSKAMTSGEESYTLLGKQPTTCYWVVVMMKFQNIWTPSDHTSGTFLLNLSSNKSGRISLIKTNMKVIYPGLSRSRSWGPKAPVGFVSAVSQTILGVAQ